MRRIPGLVVVVGTAAAVVGTAAPAVALGPLHHQTTRATVPGAFHALSVRAEVGNITIRPGAVARIVAVEQYNLKAPVLRHTVRDGVLHVSAPCPRTTGLVDLGLNDCAVDFVITVPRSTAITAIDSVGDVRVRGLRSRTLDLRSAVGDVRADLAATPRSVVARSSEGDVDITVPSGTYAVEAHSVLGQTHIDGITARSNAPRRMSAHTDTGDIRITGR